MQFTLNFENHSKAGKQDINLDLIIQFLAFDTDSELLISGKLNQDVDRFGLKDQINIAFSNQIYYPINLPNNNSEQLVK